MALSGRLNVTLDELLGGEVTPDYRIGRRHGLGTAPAGSILPLLDDGEAGMRAYLVSLPRSATVEAPSPQGRRTGSGWSAASSRCS